MRFLGGGLYGAVFEARRRDGAVAAVKVVVEDPLSCWRPPRDEVLMARRFARAGAGFELAPRDAELQGLIPKVGGVDRDDVLAGPSVGRVRPSLRCFVGWYAMEKLDATLYDFVTQGGLVAANARLLAEALKQQLRRARRAGLVHGDLHSGNVGVRVHLPDFDAERSAPASRIEVRFIDFGRSFCREDATSEAELLFGHCADVARLYGSFCDFFRGARESETALAALAVAHELLEACFVPVHRSVVEELSDDQARALDDVVEAPRRLFPYLPPLDFDRVAQYARRWRPNARDAAAAERAVESTKPVETALHRLFDDLFRRG